jgi:hypothetical protein
MRSDALAHAPAPARLLIPLRRSRAHTPARSQLPFYLAASFSADAVWASLFRASWEADRAYFGSAAYFSAAPRYGLAAGATDPACAVSGGGYEADQLAPTSVGEGLQGCRMMSPYAVAGYLPAAPAAISADLLQLLAEGDTVLSVPDLADGDVVMVRRSLLEPSWSDDAYITSVDFVSELFGLSALLIGTDFFTTFASHNFSALTPAAPEWAPP